MQFFDNLAAVPRDFGPSAVTIGKFDGVHRGHVGILNELLAHAAVPGLVPTVVSFDRNPLRILAPEHTPDSLVSTRQKVELLAEAGVEAMLQLAFDDELRAMPADVFVRHVLVDVLHARLIYTGSDFRFGAGGAGDIALLRRLGEDLGFGVELIGDVRVGEARVSSTRIRDLMGAGDIPEAAALLGRPPRVRATVVRGAQRGRELGYPTANLGLDAEGLIPADGVYAARATIEGRQYMAAVSIGNNPTFDGIVHRQVEAYLLDVSLDLYGKAIELDFVARIRGMERFDSIGALIDRMRIDVDETRAILAG